MPKFRKKPVVIEAEQWNGSFDRLYFFKRFAGEQLESVGSDLVIHTLEGDMKANVGDWVIKGVKGEIYPCKPDIFEATYDHVEE